MIEKEGSDGGDAYGRVRGFQAESGHLNRLLLYCHPSKTSLLS